MIKKKKQAAPVAPLKLDIGCGPNKKEGGFTGVDILPFDGKVDVVMDMRKKWPWKDNSVEEVHSSHFLEHLTGIERVHFFNELYRVMKPGAKALIITPHWASSRAYGDFTHQWPPVSEFLWLYLEKAWRDVNAPHCDIAHNPQGYSCNFHWSYGYAMHPSLQARNQEYQAFAMANYKEVCQDMWATITKPG